MVSISSFVRPTFPFVMVILFFSPVVMSLADTFKTPFTSMSNMTLIWGTPLGAGLMPASTNLPSRQVVLLGALALSLVHLDDDGSLVLLERAA